MKPYSLRSVTGIIEILIGGSLLLLGLFVLLSNLTCTPQAAFCAAMGALVAIVSLGPGFAILAAGLVCLRSTRFRFWSVQAVMAVAILVYFSVMLLAAFLVELPPGAAAA